MAYTLHSISSRRHNAGRIDYIPRFGPQNQVEIQIDADIAGNKRGLFPPTEVSYHCDVAGLSRRS
jgi:hypothetical protein